MSLPFASAFIFMPLALVSLFEHKFSVLVRRSFIHLHSLCSHFIHAFFFYFTSSSSSYHSRFLFLLYFFAFTYSSNRSHFILIARSTLWRLRNIFFYFILLFFFSSLPFSPSPGLYSWFSPVVACIKYKLSAVITQKTSFNIITCF